MLFQIKHAKNGWIVKSKTSDSEEVSVFECNDEYKAVESLLYDVLSQIGPMDNKYSEKRISINTMPGLDYRGNISDEYFNELLSFYTRVKCALVDNLLYRKENKQEMPNISDWDQEDYHDLVKVCRRKLNKNGKSPT